MTQDAIGARPPTRVVIVGAGFGGLACARKLRKADDVVHAYMSFIHRHFPAEEVNQFRKAEWQAVLKALAIEAENASASEANALLRANVPDYQEHLRRLFQG